MLCKFEDNNLPAKPPVDLKSILGTDDFRRQQNVIIWCLGLPGSNNSFSNKCPSQRSSIKLFLKVFLLACNSSSWPARLEWIVPSVHIHVLF